MVLNGEDYTTRVGDVGDSTPLLHMSLVEQAKKDPVRMTNNLLAVCKPVVQSRAVTWERHQRKYRRGLKYLSTNFGDAPLYFTNYVFSVVESAKANMARTLPDITAKPSGVKDDLASTIMTKMLRDSLERAGIKTVVRQVLHYGLVSTMGWFKVGYDKDVDNLTIMGLPPGLVICDPVCASYKDSRFFIHILPNQDKEKVYAEYGNVTKDNDYTADQYTETGVTSLYSSGENMQSVSDVAPNDTLYEVWVRDYAKKRKNNWYVVTVMGDEVLDAKYSPYEHNCSPFVPWVAVEDYTSDNFYTRGVGYIEEIEPLQDKADSLDMRLYKNICMTANRQKIVSAQSGINPNLVDNTNGRVLTANGDPSKAVFYDQPPQFGMEVYNYRSLIEMQLQTVSGIMDVTQGRRPTGIIAGKAIQDLRDGAEVRLQDTAATLALSIAEVGRLALSIMIQMFDKDRIVRYVDGYNKNVDYRVIAEYPPSLQPGGDAEEIAQANAQLQADQTEMGLMGQPPVLASPGSMSSPPPNNPEELGVNPEEPYVPGDPVPEDVEEIDGISGELRALREAWKEKNNVALVLEDVEYEWDVYASTDNALPTSPSDRAQVSADLFRLGAIDRLALLTSLDYPDAAGICKRLEGTVTGKNAGNTEAENGNQIDAIMQAVMATLLQIGLPQEAIPQIVQSILASVEQQGQPNQGGNFPPQIGI